jgi:predicted nucleic acid-binding protein
MLLAATAQVHNCTIVTDNERHFTGLKMLNPMRSRH